MKSKHLSVDPKPDLCQGANVLKTYLGEFKKKSRHTGIIPESWPLHQTESSWKKGHGKGENREPKGH